MIITGLLNNKTGEIIFSRARHDFRSDKTNEISIDGGFDYTKVSFKPDADYSLVSFRLNITKQELYDDWNHRKDKYGSLNKNSVKYNIKKIKI